MSACLLLGLADLVALNTVVFPHARLRWAAAEGGETLFVAPGTPVEVAALVAIPVPEAAPAPIAVPAGETGAAAPPVAPAAAEEPVIVFFATNLARLDAEGRQALGRVAALAAGTSGQIVLVEGHADVRGREAFNDRLSLSRARAVAHQLRAAGVRPQRIVVHAFGSSRPASVGSDAGALQRNRRVEILLPRRSS